MTDEKRGGVEDSGAGEAAQALSEATEPSAIAAGPNRNLSLRPPCAR